MSFERDGKALASWLLDLVADRRPVRAAAGEALQAMWQGLPDGRSIHDDLGPDDLAGMDGASDRFAVAVRAAVEADGFPTVRFVERLCALRIRLSADWLERCERGRLRRERTDALFDRGTTRLMAAGPDEVARRAVRLACAESARDEAESADAESLSPAGFASHTVFNALDTALLRSPDALPALLAYQPERHEALQALARIGPPAVGFAPMLLAEIDAGDRNHRFELPHVLGAVGRGDPATVAAVIDRLGHPDADVRNAAVATLGAMGPDLCGRTEEVVGKLLAACDDEPTRWWAVGALTAVAPADGRVADRVLALMAPRPPVREPHEQGGIRYEGDRTMFERGYAITAAAQLVAFADRVVPALVEALDSFEEFDCDERYHGEQARVCRALAAFGPLAAPAVPRLAAVLAAAGDQPRELLRLVAAIGPAAAPLRPGLLALWDDADGPPDRSSDLGAAVLAVGPG